MGDNEALETLINERIKAIKHLFPSITWLTIDFDGVEKVWLDKPKFKDGFWIGTYIYGTGVVTSFNYQDEFTDFNIETSIAIYHL